MLKRMVMRWVGYSWEENVIRHGKLYNVTRWFGREIEASEVVMEHVVCHDHDVTMPPPVIKRDRVRSLFDNNRSGQIQVNITKHSEFM